MKKQLLLLLIAASALLVSFNYADSWVNYVSHEGHFSITFPGKPQESAEDNFTADSVAFKIHYASYSPTDNEVYMVGWLDMAKFYPEGKTIKQMLEDSRDGAAESMKATDVKTLATNLGTQPYVEFTFKTGEFMGKDRIYIINKFQYSVVTIFSNTAGISAKADKFITSFKHL